MITDRVNSVRWGNLVTLPALTIAGNSTTTIFDTQVNLFTEPQVVTLTLDVEPRSITATDISTLWAYVEVGLGAYRRTFMVDFASGVQMNFAASCIRVDAVRRGGVDPTPSIKVRASVAKGSRSTSASPPMYTSEYYSIAGPVLSPGTPIVVPPHAKSFRIISGTTLPVGGDIRVGWEPEVVSAYTITPAEYVTQLKTNGGFPVLGRIMRLWSDIAAGGRSVRVQWLLDL